MFVDLFCIFCGEEPGTKTKEHVIPKWLIERTRAGQSDAIFGFDYQRQKFRRFSFRSFVFPACDDCNRRYGRLEELVKPIVEKLLQRDRVLGVEIEILLMWLDKIRIGIWCGFQYLNKDFFQVVRNYAVTERISATDRSVYIFYGEDVSPGISFLGPDWVSFWLNPTVFGIRINDVFLVNTAGLYLNAYSLGLPYCNLDQCDVRTGVHRVSCHGGTGVIAFPINSIGMPERGVMFHQAILNGADLEVIDPEEARDNAAIECPDTGSTYVFCQSTYDSWWMNSEAEPFNLATIPRVNARASAKKWNQCVIGTMQNHVERLLDVGLDKSDVETYKRFEVAARQLDRIRDLTPKKSPGGEDLY